MSTTYIAAPKDVPIGLKMEDFIMNDVSTIKDESHDLRIIEEITS